MIKIHAERDSVCIGDDVTAPNAKDFFFLRNKPIDDLMQSLCDYVPRMKDVVWEVACKGIVSGHLFSDETGQYQYKTTGSIQFISELPEHKIFCRYHY